MFFLNLSLVEFLVLFGSISAVTVALYLLDRARRKQKVATLRFWVAAGQPALTRRRRRIQQPLSLLLQLAGLALLLAAIAELRLGSEPPAPRNHVVILDTSAWMGSRQAGGRTLMDEARTRALRYLDSVASSDRVMLVRADGLATPATVFESSRDRLREAIRQSRPGATALNLDQALEFARRIQDLNPGRSGEIVVISSGRISAREAAALASTPAQRLRYVPVESEAGNFGLRKLGFRRSVSTPDSWEIYVSVRNYGAQPGRVPLALSFGGAPIASRELELAPGTDREVSFEYRTRAAGELEARLLSQDVFPEDDHALVELPSQQSLEIVVYTSEPGSLRPVFGASPGVKATFASPSQYRPEAKADVIVLDRFRPETPPQADSIWIDPPRAGSPIPVRARLSGAKLTRWNAAHPLGAGLRAVGLDLESASVFEPAPDDVRVAESDEGPVIVARTGPARTIAIGFNPAGAGLRFQLATPLLFANMLRWLAPEMFRRWELAAGSVGTVDVPVDPEVDPSGVQVSHADGSPVPFSLSARTLRFFTGTPGTVNINAGDRSLVYSLTLPELADARWEPPAGVRRGLPARRMASQGSAPLWPWLALLGAAALLAEWLLYGGSRRAAYRGLSAEPGWLERLVQRTWAPVRARVRASGR